MSMCGSVRDSLVTKAIRVLLGFKILFFKQWLAVPLFNIYITLLRIWDSNPNPF